MALHCLLLMLVWPPARARALGSACSSKTPWDLLLTMSNSTTRVLMAQMPAMTLMIRELELVCTAAAVVVVVVVAAVAAVVFV